MNEEQAFELIDVLKSIERHLAALAAGTMLARVEARDEPLNASDLRPPRDIYDPQEKL